MLDYLQVFTAIIVLMDGSSHLVPGIVAGDKWFARKRAIEIAGIESIRINHITLRAEGVSYYV